MFSLKSWHRFRWCFFLVFFHVEVNGKPIWNLFSMNLFCFYEEKKTTFNQNKESEMQLCYSEFSEDLKVEHICCCDLTRYISCFSSPISWRFCTKPKCSYALEGSFLPLVCADHISHRHLFWPWLHARLCREWCRNGWTVGMAETEEEALRWKVHLKGFGNNPLKLPQGIRWNGLHLDSPLCSCRSLGPHLFKR